MKKKTTPSEDHEADSSIDAAKGTEGDEGGLDDQEVDGEEEAVEEEVEAEQNADNEPKMQVCSASN